KELPQTDPPSQTTTSSSDAGSVVDAVYHHGAIEPAEPTDLPTGAQLQVHRLPAIVVTVEPHAPVDEARRSSADDVYSPKTEHHESRRSFFTSLLPAGKLTLIVLCAALLIGGFMRLYGLNWDQGAHYHPDERWITMITSSLGWPGSVDEFMDTRRSPLNPYYDVSAKRARNFAYGTLPVYLTKVVAWVLGGFDKKWTTYDYIPLVGRALSSLLDVGAILLVFLLGRRLFGEWVGIRRALLRADGAQHPAFAFLRQTLRSTSLFCSPSSALRK
ncbi:MAG: hypothetical protein WKF30_18105, partial [Pyrinomonadaceae bacterium]